MAKNRVDKKSSEQALTAPARLRLLVATAGLVLMALEIAGSRVLAPHFGNSTFVWGSLISVFLIALATGYFLGGHLADRIPSQRLLNIICIIVAAWIYGLAALGHPICEAVLDAGAGDQFGPLIASAILFLPPSVGLGIISPFSVRIAATSLESVGRVSGTLYALSTLGSIAGTLVATFVMIPLFGVAANLRIIASLLLIVATITLPSYRNALARASLLVVLLILVGGLMIRPASATRLLPGEKIVVEQTSPYHHVAVIDNAQAGSRQLRFDHYIETMIKLSPPYATLGRYTNYFHIAFLLRPQMDRVLFIGAGGGVGPRAFLAQDPRLKIDVVDIDPRVLDLARQYFFVPDSPSIRMIAQDGRIFLRRSDATYDCIVLDVFTIGGRIPFHLVTKEALELCRAHLSDDGVFVMNVSSALQGPRSEIYRSMHRTLDAVFPETFVFREDRTASNLTNPTNVILVATKRKRQLSPEQWATLASSYRSESSITTDEMNRIVGDLVIDIAPDPAAALLTDDYAPIETMRF